MNGYAIQGALEINATSEHEKASDRFWYYTIQEKFLMSGIPGLGLENDIAVTICHESF